METKIITKGLPKDNEILLDEAVLTYVQNPDCTEDPEDDWQKITISLRDNGVSKFLNIKTNNWSLDSEEELVTLIKDYKTRVGYE